MVVGQVGTGLSIKVRKLWHLLQLRTFDGSLMLQFKLPLDDTIHQKDNKFATGVKIKATDDSKRTCTDSWDNWEIGSQYFFT